MTVRISVAVDRATWRALHDLAEERKVSGGRTSMARVIRDLIAGALAVREGPRDA
jgi:hypothetical protein